MKFISILVAASLLLFCAVLLAQEPASIDSRIDELLARMTLEEKLGQLTLYTAHFGPNGSYVEEGYLEKIRQGKAGAIFNAFGAGVTRELQRVAVEESRLKIPLLFGFDVVHGFKTIFPIPLAEAASFDLDAMERSARIAAVEAAAAGLHWTFAPMVDIARDPRWGRIAEGAGEDPYLGSVVAAARVRGFQGKNLAAHDTILACAKHFAAYGAAEAGRDYNTVDMSELRFREVYLPPFQAAVDAGVATFMSAFNDFNGVPCTGDRWLLTDVLRQEMGFRGFVVSDYTSIAEMIAHGFAGGPADAARLALLAGLDMDMQSGLFEAEIPELAAQGLVPESSVDQAVRRILRAKFELGLFENPYAYCDSEREKKGTMTQEHLDAALDMAQKSIVLLKNQGSLLPLSRNVGTIALIGPLADDRRELLGSWCGAGDHSQATPLLAAVRNSAPKARILHARGCEIEGDSTDGFAEALSAAREADIVIMALGESAMMSGEAASRANLDLPGVQGRLLAEVHKTGKPVVLVLMNGRPLVLNWADENIPAILECWFLGTRAGDAIAGVLFGDCNPSGRLPVTFPRSVGQIPIYYACKTTGRPATSEKYTSKYLDVENAPLYPFGFGLGYTTFAYSPVKMRLSRKSIKMGQSITAHVTVQNKGQRAGTEVAQLYLRQCFGSVTPQVNQLVGFRRVTLQAGESAELEFCVTPEQMSFVDRSMRRVQESGLFRLMAGSNSRDLISKAFMVEE